MSLLTAEALADIRADAEFTSRAVGAPGSPIRDRAKYTLLLLDEHAELLAKQAPIVVDHPDHYSAGGTEDGRRFEAILIIEAAGWGEGFCLGNALKYLLRAPHKGTFLADVQKARWYLLRARGGRLRRLMRVLRMAWRALGKDVLDPHLVLRAHGLDGRWHYPERHLADAASAILVGDVDAALSWVDAWLACEGRS